MNIDKYSYFPLECKCTDEIKRLGEYIGAQCKDWAGNDGFAWCYLHGAADAHACPGAVKSQTLNYYWSKDPAVCKPKGTYECQEQQYLANLLFC